MASKSNRMIWEQKTHSSSSLNFEFWRTFQAEVHRLERHSHASTHLAWFYILLNPSVSSQPNGSFKAEHFDDQPISKCHRDFWSRVRLDSPSFGGKITYELKFKHDEWLVSWVGQLDWLQKSADVLVCWCSSISVDNRILRTEEEPLSWRHEGGCIGRWNERH